MRFMAYWSVISCASLANAFKVDEDEIWSWVERERHDPTAEITHAS